MIAGRDRVVSSSLTQRPLRMPAFDSNSLKLILDHHLGPQIGVGILNHQFSTGSIGGKDDRPPQPVEPYGNWKPLGAVGHNIPNPSLTERLDHYKIIHDSDGVLAGKPQGPKKPIRPPQPFDPYGSRKPSSAPRGVGSGPVNTGSYNLLMKSFTVRHTIGHTVYALAQSFGAISTAKVSVNV